MKCGAESREETVLSLSETGGRERDKHAGPRLGARLYSQDFYWSYGSTHVVEFIHPCLTAQVAEYILRLGVTESKLAQRRVVGRRATTGLGKMTSSEALPRRSHQNSVALGICRLIHPVGGLVAAQHCSAFGHGKNCQSATLTLVDK